MPAVEAILEHGAIPSSGMVNETSLLVQSVTKSATRDEKTYMNADGSIAGVQYRNPVLTFSYDCYVSEYSGLAVANPGSEVTSLANFTEDTLGFTPGDGTLVFTDPTITESNSESAKMTFSVKQLPFCA